MIIDKLTNSYLYADVSDRIKKAFSYLSETDFSNLSTGRHDFDGDNMFVIVNEYITKENDLDILEAHKKYIDLQYVVKGCEIVDYETHDNHKVSKEYDEENDYLFYHTKEITKLKLNKGMFAIFFPGDLHMPGIEYINPVSVRKIVVKILIDK